MADGAEPCLLVADGAEPWRRSSDDQTFIMLHDGSDRKKFIMTVMVISTIMAMMFSLYTDAKKDDQT